MKQIASATMQRRIDGAMAQFAPAGLWKTFDDDAKKEESLVRISESAGVFTGYIEKLLDPAQQTSVCDKCTDERKDQPVVGMVILRGVRQDASDKSLWSGGDILDSNNGEVYTVRLRPVEGASKPEVRGYIGVPLLGRTQTSVRIE